MYDQKMIEAARLRLLSYADEKKIESTEALVNDKYFYDVINSVLQDAYCQGLKETEKRDSDGS